MNDLSSKSYTAKYWCLYSHNIGLMTDYITAEKIEDTLNREKNDNDFRCNCTNKLH